MAINQKGRSVAVDAVVIQDGKILLGKRDSEQYKGYWVLPGGFVERNETTEEAVVREVKEETGAKVELLGLI